MKKTKLTRSLLAACSIVALSAVMYGCVHSSDDPEPMVEMPEPMEPAGPTDLDETQAAAMAAATAAMTASGNAEEAAARAKTATASIATLQTNGMAADHATAAREAADDAMAAYADAKAASAAAAAATTGDAGEVAWRTAVTAQEAAEAAEATAADMAAAAREAAMTELHINGTVKTVGDSSVDADADKLTSVAGDRTTGFLNNVTSAADEVTGQEYVEATATPYYRQAVAARDVKIGKTLDTSDDTARLTVIHSRAGSEMARVYAIENKFDTNEITAQGDGTWVGVIDSASVILTLPLKSLGMHYEASSDGRKDAAGKKIGVEDALDHTDIVEKMTKPKELFSYVNATSGATVHVVETSRTIKDGLTTTVKYAVVDILAPAAPDAHGAALDDRVPTGSDDKDETPESIPVKASIPVAVEYSHIHFGIWAGLGAAGKDGSQKLADLGVGFVQNIDGSGVTDKQGIGSVTYSGDWVAAVQRQNAAADTGAINLYDGAATLRANFDTDKFTGTLTGLARLEGTLDGNGFSGITAKAITHDDLDSTGTFSGTFSGGIYGDKGEEAAGVFDFNGGEAGAFRGAFGGTNQK